MRYRKKPIVIEAIKFDGSNTQEINDFMGVKTQEESCSVGIDKDLNVTEIMIYTLEGNMTASIGDFIIKEPFPTETRKFYPCKPDIFEATYEEEI